mmetsp:Transcript_19691/g.28321  ORF Transcript_19691/g.28321 Transcript_19691/m.28321 type:complete len:516 (-) Transcript_19691:113-1660(-)
MSSTASNAFDDSYMQRRTSLTAAIREAVLDMHIKKHVWKPPQLHRDTHLPPTYAATGGEVRSRYDTHREETWYELFYDLVFVAAAIQIGHIAQSDISVIGLFKSGLMFAVMRATWDQLMFYQNRFDTKDLVHYVYYLVQAMCAFIMAEHLTVDENDGKWDEGRNLVPFAVAVVTARLLNSAMYFQVMSLSTAYRHHLLAVSLSLIFAAIVYILPVLLPGQYYVYWMTALMCERTCVMLYIRYFIPNDDSALLAPWHMGHLIHREGTFILLILGEAIIQLVQHPGGLAANDYARGLMGFATVFNVGDMYYQQQLLEKEVIRDYHTKSPSYLWISVHLLLSMSILFFAAGIKLVYDEELGERKVKEEFLMCTSASICIGLIFVLRMQYKGVFYAGVNYYRYLSYAFRFSIAGICATIPVFTHDSTRSVGALFVLTSVLVVQDLFSHSASVSRTNSICSSAQTGVPKPSADFFEDSSSSGNKHPAFDINYESEVESLVQSLIDSDKVNHENSSQPSEE